MAIRLTEQQQHALDTTDAEPPQVVDPRTNAAYVLIPLIEYEAVREIIDNERQQRAIRAAGLRNAERRVDDVPDEAGDIYVAGFPQAAPAPVIGAERQRRR